jgi:hypothetical protein
MKRIAGRCSVALASAILCCALSGCGGGGASGYGGAPGGGGPPSCTGSACEGRLIVGDGVDAIWSYVLHGPAPGSPVRFSIPNVQMNGGIDFLVTLAADGIHVVEPQTFNGSHAVDAVTIPLTGPRDASVTGLATDNQFHVYAAVGNGVLAFATTPGTTQPFASIKLPNGPASTGTVAIGNDLSVAVQTGDAGPHGKVSVQVFNPVTQGAAERATVALPDGSLGDPMAYDIQGRLLVDHANTLLAYTITTTTGKLTASSSLPSGPATFAVDVNNEVYVLAGPTKPTQGQTETIEAYVITNFQGGLKKVWSQEIGFAGRWLALAP